MEPTKGTGPADFYSASEPSSSGSSSGYKLQKGVGAADSYSANEPSSSAPSSSYKPQKWYSRAVQLLPFRKSKVIPEQLAVSIDDRKDLGKGGEIASRLTAEQEKAVDDSLIRAVTPHFNFSESVESTGVGAAHVISYEEDQPLILNGAGINCWESIQNHLHRFPHNQLISLQRNEKMLQVPSIILKLLSKQKPDIDELFKDDYPLMLAEEKIITINGFARFFLMMHSPVFKAMWTHSFQASEPGHLTNLSQLTQDDFQKLLDDLLYKPSGISGRTLELLNIANEWGISLLEKKYQNDLNHFIKGFPLDPESLDQVLDILEFAQDRNLKDVVDSAQDYLDSYIYQIKDQDEFIQFLKHLTERKIILNVTTSLPAVADISWLDILFSFPIKKLSLANRRDATNDWLKKLPAMLTELNLFKCLQITDEGLNTLPSSLISLNLGHCPHITTTGIKFLPPHLRFLNVSNCINMTNDCMKQLQINCPQLQSLNISNCKLLTDEIRDFFPSSLVELNAAFSSLSDVGVSHLPKTLKVLNVSNSSLINGTSFSQLPRTLESLNAGWCPLENRGLKDLPYQLRELILNGCQDLSSEGLSNIPLSIEILNIAHCTQLNDEDLQLICARLQLRSLNISSCLFTDKGLTGLPPSLLSLNASSCSNLTVAVLIYFPKSLSALNLANCTNVSDEWLAFLHDFLALEELDIGNCKKITGKGLKYLTPSLLKLNLSGFINLNLECFRSFPPLLQSLNVTNCSGITKESLKFLPASLLSLNISMNQDLCDDWLNNIPPNLQEIIMNGCSRITHLGISLLPASLRLLNLSNTLITDKGLVVLPRFLRTLIIINCRKMTKNAVEALSSSLKIISSFTY